MVVLFRTDALFYKQTLKIPSRVGCQAPSSPSPQLCPLLQVRFGPLLSAVAFSQPVSDELGCFLPSVWVRLAVSKIIWEK